MNALIDQQDGLGVKDAANLAESLGISSSSQRDAQDAAIQTLLALPLLNRQRVTHAVRNTIEKTVAGEEWKQLGNFCEAKGSL